MKPEPLENKRTPKEMAIRWYWEKQGLPEVNANVSLSNISQDSDLGLAIDIAIEEQINNIKLVVKLLEQELEKLDSEYAKTDMTIVTYSYAVRSLLNKAFEDII